MRDRLARGLGAGVVLLLPAVLATPARAQLSGLSTLGGKEPITRDQPVAFTADSVSYDRDNGIVTATGHVEAWQNDHVLRADKITFDRNTNVAAASGHVVLLEPDGQVVFSDYAELSEGMRNGVLRGMRVLLAENGKLAANGARRTEGKINELSRVVYSTCDLCKEDPTKPPLWQIRALSAVQDAENKRIEYSDAEVEMWGVPVAYFPYFWHADPSVKRASGLLIPSVGISSHIGAFASIPYYGVLDDQSDLTITPLFTTEAGPNLDLGYRRRFNDGDLTVNGSIGYLNDGIQGLVDAKGRFTWDDTWRYGFDLERASSSQYVTDFHLSPYITGTPDLLTSQAYHRRVRAGRLFPPGREMVSGSRDQHRRCEAADRAAALRVQLFRPGRSLWRPSQRRYAGFQRHSQRGHEYPARKPDRQLRAPVRRLARRSVADHAAWRRGRLQRGQIQRAAEFQHLQSNTTARALPQVAGDFRWPFLRNSGSWGSQVLEPRVQLVVAPNAGNSQLNKIPNEDSLDLEFTDANLFGFNRFPGIDRLEGGTRANVAMQGSWFLNGTLSRRADRPVLPDGEERRLSRSHRG